MKKKRDVIKINLRNVSSVAFFPKLSYEKFDKYNYNKIIKDENAVKYDKSMAEFNLAN